MFMGSMGIKTEMDYPPLSEALMTWQEDLLKEESTWDPEEYSDSTYELPLFDDDLTSTLFGTNYQIKSDCMWNGHSKGTHGRQRFDSESYALIPPGEVKPPPVTQVSSQQQSLLKPELKLGVDPNTVLPMVSSPYCLSLQTPPISDDEDVKVNILESLQEAISENDIDDAYLDDFLKGGMTVDNDSDWGFLDDVADEETPEETEQKPNLQELQIRENERRAYYAATDHSYHKGTYADMHSDIMGIDTPSDSDEEEEIDVVSLGDRMGAKTARAALLSPANQDRSRIQRAVPSRYPQGIKTIMPVKKSPKKPEARTRGRQYKKVKQNTRQYKRRNYGHSSDDEPEPSEKRHLHNNMERQRRIDLRNLFNDLKKLVPDVAKRQRAAKVAILKAAASYCLSLQNDERKLNKTAESLRQSQAYLHKYLKQLRREVVASRR